MFDGSPASQKSIAVVQPGNDKDLVKKLCSMFCQKGPDISDVVQYKTCKIEQSLQCAL